MLTVIPRNPSATDDFGWDKLRYARLHSDICYKMLPLRAHGYLLFARAFLTPTPFQPCAELRSPRKCFSVFALCA